MNIPAAFAVALGLACACPGLGCGKADSPGASVPEDCRKWLDAYFDALKSKDVAKVQDLCARVSARIADMLPAEGAETVRGQQRETTAGLLGKIAQDLGDFRSYAVESCRETVIPADDPMANALGEGRHIEILLATRYSKRNARERFVLSKGPRDAEFIVEAHNISYSPF
ncbi:MAG: hypothetical protein AAB215_03360 [Planctomycetota bacterium]